MGKRELIQVTDSVRVENGPARLFAVATKELLDDAVTASHYKEGLPDAAGKGIVIGQSMMYLDYKGEWVWYVYQLEDVPIEAEVVEKITAARVKEGEALSAEILADWFGVDPAHIVADPWRVKRFMPRGPQYTTKEAALEAAGKLEA